MRDFEQYKRNECSYINRWNKNWKILFACLMDATDHFSSITFNPPLFYVFQQFHLTMSLFNLTSYTKSQMTLALGLLSQHLNANCINFSALQGVNIPIEHFVDFLPTNM